MHSYRDIKFTDSQATSKLAAGKVCYQGQVIHNQTLNEAETRKAFADYARLKRLKGNLAKHDNMTSRVRNERDRDNIVYDETAHIVFPDGIGAAIWLEPCGGTDAPRRHR